MPRAKPPIRLLPAAALVFVLSGASLACTSNIPIVGRTKTPTPTATPTVTLTPTATRTCTPSKTPTPLPTAMDLDWPVILYDTFDNNSNGWWTSYINDPFAKGTVSISGGKYRFELAAKQPVFYVSAPNLRPQTDFYLAVDVLKTSGYTEANYGLFFRIGDQTGYYYSLNADEKKYQMDLIDHDNWYTKKGPSVSAKIQYDKTNRISVLAEGSRLTLFINGEETHSLVDATLSEGLVGIGFCLFTIGDGVVIEYDNFEVRTPNG